MSTLHLILRPYRGFWQAADLDARTIRAGCGHLAWLTPAGEGFLADQQPTTSCMDCYQPGNYDDCSIVPGALELIREHHGDAGVEVARTRMRALKLREP